MYIYTYVMSTRCNAPMTKGMRDNRQKRLSVSKREKAG